MRVMASCLVLTAAATGGCLRATAFVCASDTDCGAAGQCELNSYCSIPNTQCPGGRSFSDSAGQSLSNTCVPIGNPDAGPDAAIDARMIDAPPDIPVGCPTGYAAIAGSIHVYKTLLNVQWNEGKNDCKATSSSAYLAVPDDAAELVNLATLATVATAPFWVGIDDQTAEGMFVIQKGLTAATFLPWKAGGIEPDNGPPDEDCVAAISSTEIETERCGNRHAAVCECEP